MNMPELLNNKTFSSQLLEGLTESEYEEWADGYEACSRGLECPPDASALYSAGYGRKYEEEARSEHGY